MAEDSPHNYNYAAPNTILMLPAPTEPASHAGGVYTKLLQPFHSFLASSFCLPALLPTFHSKNSPRDTTRR